MTQYKNRTIDPNKPARVYRNLHKNTFSVVQDGLVVAHVDQLCLRDAKPFVSEYGRQQVLKTRRKNVHAWIEGYICQEKTPESLLEVRYNPYKYRKFCVGPEGQEQVLIRASYIWLDYPLVFV